MHISFSSIVVFGRNYSQLGRKRNPYLDQKVTSLNVAISKSTMVNTAVATPAKQIFKPLVWIDCEMTGLDHTKDRIIEICCIVTDGHLNIVDDNCYESVLHCDADVMAQMNEWCVEHHGKSGLTRKVIECEKTREQVEKELLEFIQKLVPQPRVGVLAGNSVHMDRLFMLKDFPHVIDHLFYRIVDVSSLMEVSFRHNPTLASFAPRKDKNHTAKSDILESIEQLRWYRDNYLKDEQETKYFVKQQQQERELDKLKQQLQTLQAQIQTQDLPSTTEKRPKEIEHGPVLKSRKL